MSQNNIHHSMVCVGQLHHSFGVVGQIKLSFVFPVKDLISCSTFFYQIQKQYKPLIIKELKPFQQSWLIQFENFNTLEAVKPLSRSFIFLPEEQIQEYFEYEKPYNLTCFEVLDQKNNVLGIIDHIQPSPAQDLLVVINKNNEEKLIPNIKPFILDIDEEKQQVKVDFSILEDLYHEN